MKRVIIDNDGEFDDSFALIFALKSRELNIEAITTLGGIRDINYVTADVLNIIELLNKNDVPVAKGLEHPLFRDITATRQRINTIYTDAGRTSPAPIRQPTLKPLKEHAVDLIISKIMENPGEITLITLGALTNVAVALLKEPRIAKKVKEAYTMGGAVIAPGNVSPVAEFNIWGDPEAAKIYFNSGIPITLVGLEVYYSCSLTGKEWNIVKQGNTANKYVFDNFDPWYKYLADRRPELEGGEEIGDALTIGVLIDRTLVEIKKIYVDVETKGDITIGQTVGYGIVPIRNPPPKTPNVTLCVNVNAERFNNMFIERVIN